MTVIDPLLPPLLRVRGLHFAFEGMRLFESLDFDVLPGEATLLVGENGSGKSTLLRLLAGLLPPDGGSIERAADVDGEPVAVAWLGHTLGLKTSLTVIENLRFALGLNGHDRRLTPAQALSSVGLEDFDEVPARELSAGQRKRVALARLLLSPAAVWLLDEPYANLDPNGCQLVDRLVDRHLRAGGAAVLSLHHEAQTGLGGARRLLALGTAAS
jgi:heme exporter protein A